MQNNKRYKILIKYYKILYTPILNNKKLCITLITVYVLLHPSVYTYYPDMLHVCIIVAELFSGIELFTQITMPFDIFVL